MMNSAREFGALTGFTHHKVSRLWRRDDMRGMLEALGITPGPAEAPKVQHPDAAPSDVYRTPPHLIGKPKRHVDGTMIDYSKMAF